MARTLIDCPLDYPKDPEPHPGYEIKLIAPLFGGGVKAGQNDPTLPIRSSSIRGHLRFWWRATRGTAFPTIEELRQREAEIWGSTEIPSPVAIRVDMTQQGAATKCARYDWNPEKSNGNGGYDLHWAKPFDAVESSLPYALFPFQGQAPDSDDPKDPASCILSASFKLEIAIPEPKQMEKSRAHYNRLREKLNLSRITDKEDDIALDVEVALWAWTNFGGIGARTRRGCGALYCKDFAPPSQNETMQWYETWIKKANLKHSDLSFSFIEFPPLVSSNLKLPLDAWEEAIRLMRQFRQEPTGRRPRPQPHKHLSKHNKPGRSYWPEPESIRNYAARRSANHPRLAHIPNDAFPRAEFGLPIVFHFIGAGEPADCELYPLEKTRMASPIILRPLAVGDGKKAIAMVLQLNSPSLGALELKKITSPPTLSRTNIVRPDLANPAYSNSPMGVPHAGSAKRSPSGSALEAFMAFANENNFQAII